MQWGLPKPGKMSQVPGQVGRQGRGAAQGGSGPAGAIGPRRPPWVSPRRGGG